MKLKVLAFAALRDRLGFAEREWEVADGATAGEAAAAVFAGPVPKGVAFAVNQSYVNAGHKLGDGDELALLPPVSGG